MATNTVHLRGRRHGFIVSPFGPTSGFGSRHEVETGRTVSRCTLLDKVQPLCYNQPKYGETDTFAHGEVALTGLFEGLTSAHRPKRRWANERVVILEAVTFPSHCLGFYAA
jgi:hypothetical protein